MADPKTDVDQLNSALARIGERAAADPAYLESLRANQVEELRAAGVTVFALSGAFAEEGAEEEEEVAAFGFAGMAASSRPAGGILASNTCIGTCSSLTITVCCSKSFTGAASGGAAGGAALGGA